MLATQIIKDIFQYDPEKARWFEQLTQESQSSQVWENNQENKSYVTFRQLAIIYNLLISFVDNFWDIHTEDFWKIAQFAEDLADDLIEPSAEVFLAQSKNNREAFLHILSFQNQRLISEEEYITYLVAKKKFKQIVNQTVKKLELEKKFLNLAAQWRQETYTVSSTTALANHPAYQEIIAMGEPVIPLLLRELEKKSGQWFMALKAISKQNPVPPELKGKTQEMTTAWLKWGREKGYKW